MQHVQHAHSTNITNDRMKKLSMREVEQDSSGMICFIVELLGYVHTVPPPPPPTHTYPHTRHSTHTLNNCLPLVGANLPLSDCVNLLDDLVTERRHFEP